MLTCFREDYGSEEFGERGLAILRLLEPALEAGIAGRVGNPGGIDALDLAFAASRDGLLILDARGRRLEANRAFEDIAGGDPERDRIEAAVHRVSCRLQSLLGRRTAGEAIADLGSVTARVRTIRARYGIAGHLAAGNSLGTSPAIIISVQRLTPDTPTAEDIREAWKLSPQETRVALLLSQGKTNAGVAAYLGLSPTTARHYTEAVFAKLGVSSRAEAAYTILSH